MMALQEIAVLNGFNVIYWICKDKKTSKPFEKEADRRFGVRPKKSIFSFGKKKKSKDRTGNEIELGGEEKIDS